MGVAVGVALGIAVDVGTGVNGPGVLVSPCSSSTLHEIGSQQFTSMVVVPFVIIGLPLNSV